MDKTVHIPAFISYGCVRCGSCCVRFDITFTPDDYDRLKTYPWAQYFPRLAGRTLFEPCRQGGATVYRFPHDPQSGRCVFLEDDRCLIHHKMGLHKKVYACQCYPYTFAVTPTGIYLGVRFDCRGMGQEGAPALMEDCKNIEWLARAFPAQTTQLDYGKQMFLKRAVRRTWDELLEVESLFMGLFVRRDAPIRRRVLAAALLVDHLSRPDVSELTPEEFLDVCNVMVDACWDNAAHYQSSRSGERTGRALGRQLLSDLLLQAPALYRDWSPGRKLRFRFGTFWHRIRFALGLGVLASEETPPVPIRAVEQCRLEPDDTSTQFVATFLAAKLFGKNYYGPLFYDYPFLDGLAVLIAVYAGIISLARANAVARGETEALRMEDVGTAVRVIDYRYGALRMFGMAPARLRASLLRAEGVLPGLLWALSK